MQKLPAMKYFEYEHLPRHLQSVSMIFHDAAYVLAQMKSNDPDQIRLALEHLLVAKDAAVRAFI